jgi:hypothetical protein
VLLQQQQRHRLADDVAAADHDRLGAGELDARALEQVDDSIGRAGLEALRADDQPADVDRVEAVDVLVGVDRGDDLVLVGGSGSCGIPSIRVWLSSRRGEQLGSEVSRQRVLAQQSELGAARALPDIDLGRPVLAHRTARGLRPSCLSFATSCVSSPRI